MLELTYHSPVFISSVYRLRHRQDAGNGRIDVEPTFVRLIDVVQPLHRFQYKLALTNRLAPDLAHVSLYIFERREETHFDATPLVAGKQYAALEPFVSSPFVERARDHLVVTIVTDILI